MLGLIDRAEQDQLDLQTAAMRMGTALRCPRCDAWLLEIERDPRYLRYFLCGECCSAWRFCRVKRNYFLVQGRLVREVALA